MKYPNYEAVRNTNPFALMVRHWNVYGYVGYLKMYMKEAMPEVLQAIGTLLLALLHVIFFPLMPIIFPTIAHIRAKRHYAYTEKLRREYRK